MNLTKKQKIYGGLLIVAVAAVFVDQVIIGSDVAAPQQASAQLVEAPSNIGNTLAAGPVGSKSSVPDREQLITTRLADAARQKGVGFASLRDAFEPAESWVGNGGTTQTVARTGLTAEQFENKYPLMAVITTGGKSYAVVGNRTLRVGQVLDGFKLIAVRQRKAVFASDAGTVELKLSVQP